MNSVQQEFLLVMGIDTYYPRWPLPFAAESHEYSVDESVDTTPPCEPIIDLPETPQTNNLLLDVLGNIEKQNKVAEIKNPEIKVPSVEAQSSAVVQPFSLSVWRPASGFLVIADRTTDALPTELLMQNILRFYMNNYSQKVEEDILRWPAVQTTQLALTEENACTELQTWLSVQHELQPLERVWFFGEAWKYFVQKKPEFKENYFVVSIEVAQNLQAKCFPCLARLLQNPQLKVGLLGLV